MTKLNRPLVEMLARIAEHNSASGPMLALLITASGGREATKLWRLIAHDLVDVVDHPTVTTRDRILDRDFPAQALRVTAEGLKFLDLKPENIGLPPVEAEPVLTRKPRLEEILAVITAASHALRSYQYGNASPDLAKSVANDLDAIAKRLAP